MEKTEMTICYHAPREREGSRADTEIESCFVVVVLAFTVPKAYELNKKEVDNVVNSVQKQSKTYYKQYAEPYIQKIPRASTSTANTGSVTAGNHTGDAADSYARAPKSNLQAELNAAAHQQPKKFPWKSCYHSSQD